MKELIVSLLDPPADFLFRMVNAVPLRGALAANLILLTGMIIWIWTLRGEKKGAQTDKPGLIPRDLRIWATVILGIQILLYLVFG